MLKMKTISQPLDSTYFNFNNIDDSWIECLERGLQEMDPTYLEKLVRTKNWLPGPEKIFNAFSQPLDHVKYVLFGESPYPREASANGYAFWDAAVKELWSETGLSKPVNRATSLRNILKMLLVAEGLLDKKHCGQEDIAKLDKTALVQTNDEFFENILNRGFLLLNTTPILTLNSPQKDALAWQPFMRELFTFLCEKKPNIELILLGRIAKTIHAFVPSAFQAKREAEHPYNISFITNPAMLSFFKPLHLLKRTNGY